jgi:hypothetical protein
MQKDEENQPEPQTNEQSLLDKYAWIGFPIIILFWFGYGFFQGEISKDLSFDRLNTLFSGLAFWGVIWAILLQKSELVLQREELKMTRREVHGQKVELAAQNLTMKQQRFESTFFSLLNLYGNIVNSMTMESSQGGPALRGRDCFTYMATEFKRQFMALRQAHSDWEPLALCDKAYSEFAGPRNHLIGHYYRTLFNIVQFIDASDICDKQTYCNFVRAQLSTPELTFLFYTCINEFGREKLKPLVRKYGLLETMAQSNLLDPAHKELFD